MTTNFHTALLSQVAGLLGWDKAEQEENEAKAKAHFKQLIGKEIPAGSLFLPPAPSPFALSLVSGELHVEGDLVIFATGFPATLVFDPVIHSVRLEGLPVEEVRLALRPIEINWEGKFPFEVAVEAHDSVSVMLAVYGYDLSAGELLDVLHHAQRTWNSGNPGLIHSIGPVGEGIGCILIAVDLGTAQIQGLHALVDSLKVLGNHVKRVEVRDVGLH